MKRYAYLNRLEELLADLPREDRRRALQHYEEAFRMAEPGREEEVAAQLGSPETVAEHIRKARAAQREEARGRLLLAVLALVLVVALAVGIGALSDQNGSSGSQAPDTASAQTEMLPGGRGGGDS